MKKLLILLPAILLLASCSAYPSESEPSDAQPQNNAETPTNGPRISFDRAEHDFGEIPQSGGKVSTAFTIKNTGKADLEIGQVTTSCSCTSAKIGKNKIPAGNSTILTVTFDPNLHEEPKEKFKRIIFIPSNDPENPENTVVVWVDILESK